MGAGEFIPSGEPVRSAADTPPGSPVAQEKAGLGGALILPVFFAMAAWAVEWFTRSALGKWRYIPVTVLGLCAMYFMLLAVVLAIVFNASKAEPRRAPRWLARTANVLFVALFVAGAGMEVVRAVRDDSILDAVSALIIVLWAGSIPDIIPGFTALPRARKRVYRVASLLMPVWITVLAVFHLH